MSSKDVRIFSCDIEGCRREYESHVEASTPQGWAQLYMSPSHTLIHVCTTCLAKLLPKLRKP